MVNRPSDESMPPPYASPRQAALAGMRDALGAPALALGASYVGFGSLCRANRLTLWLGLASTSTGWALPGQIVLVELYGMGASLLVVTLSVALTNARLLPMAVTLMPLLRHAGTPRWRYYLFSHFIAVTAWVFAMRRCPDLPSRQRLPYFAGFGATLWLVTILCTAAGFLMARQLPEAIRLGLVFLNPLYFLLVFAGDANLRARILPVGLGAVLGPLLHRLDPDWGLLATGLIAGTAAFAAERGWRRRRG